jgi:hypothetical protein
MAINSLYSMSKEDARNYFTLWAKTRDPLWLHKGKVAAQAHVSLVAFRLARDKRWTIFLDGDSQPYVWFDTSISWAAHTRLYHVANTTGRKANLYLEGDFLRTYSSAEPRKVKVIEPEPNTYS